MGGYEGFNKFAVALDLETQEMTVGVDNEGLKAKDRILGLYLCDDAMAGAHYPEVPQYDLVSIL